MVEITINNFEEKYPEIVNSLTNAVFIAVDTEFTGLLSDPELKSSLFDTGAERYDKLRQNIGHFIIMEAGITTFRFVQDKNKYEANKYTFYVFPRSFSSIDSKFTCQASCLEFLCQHNFDFNKFVYGGVPYLNRQQEECLRKELREGSLFRNLERTISHDDEKSIQLVCSRVAEWAASAVLEDTLHLDNFDICQGEKRLSYVVHKELRQRFPDIWTFQDSGQIQVKKISEMQRKEYEENKEKDKSMEEDMLDSLLGFSRLFKLLIELKKPIVGHNLLLDLMIMYNQFHEQLPTQFSDFKKKIRKLFPVVYDTKFLSYEMKRILKKEDLWDSNVLSNLYHYFKEGRGRHVVLYSPIIELKGEDGGHVSDPQEARLKMLGQSEDRDEKFHEAGWDSFCTGYCFIRMAHIYASLSFGRNLTSREHLSSVASKKNCLNVIRAYVSHVCLDGPDPPSDRPKLLHVQVRGFRTVDISKIAELFAGYGAVDVKQFTRYRALVAVGNHVSAKDIVTKFRKHKDFHVSYYHPIWHSPIVRTCLWTGVTVSGGIFAYLLYKEFGNIRTARTNSVT